MEAFNPKGSLSAVALRAGRQIVARMLLCWGGAVALSGCAAKAPEHEGSFSTFSRSEEEVQDPAPIETLADFLANEVLAEGKIPGITLAIAQHGELVFARGYGQADVELEVPVDLETVYRANAITQQFTAALILRLVEAGKLSLDDPITQYLPEFPTQDHQVTLRHLLSHTSGIGKDLTIGQSSVDQAGLQQEFPLERIVERFKTLPFRFSPGEQSEPNSMGYYLLGIIIGRVTGIPYAYYLEQELLQPLGLSHTRYEYDQRIIPDRAKGYTFSGNQLLNAPYASAQAEGAAGALCSTAEDLVRWTYLLHSGQVVSQASLQQMMAPTVLITGDTVGYGYGIYLDELARHPKVYQEGSSAGFGAYLSHYPADGLTIAILTNSGLGKEKAAEIEELLACEILRVPAPSQQLTVQTMNLTEQAAYANPASPECTELSELQRATFLIESGDNGRKVRPRY
ncbi:serine hydrolase domain-containing protein [Sabulibacter ruber]|uniref:serine hydrolase domain-containing protein n=1 Tax=Sabulibacter ruber TaxID=2811901 RepID=UPI001A9707A0|nr:serine hydrolase domain-containing protein [Sabulibacter ruber]